MLLEIDHHSGVPIYRQIIDQIRKLIMAGSLAPGEQLMTVRDLAAGLKVNPMTVSKAYSLLEMEGLLERRRGVGLFVAELADNRRARTSVELIEQSLARAVATAVQLGIRREQVALIVDTLYAKYDSTQGSNDHEH
ncbi:MAG TPA: GntR family transcriptional regulator [Phycisphaerales bacterium]|nr:GntR family transcriptional regulator [Phycisphaerales bacterium]